MKETNYYGISWLSLLGIVFIILKLFEVTVVATWSWWWVTLPIWGPVAFVFIIIIAMSLIAVALTWKN